MTRRKKEDHRLLLLKNQHTIRSDLPMEESALKAKCSTQVLRLWAVGRSGDDGLVVSLLQGNATCAALRVRTLVSFVGIGSFVCLVLLVFLFWFRVSKLVFVFAKAGVAEEETVRFTIRFESCAEKPSLANEIQHRWVVSNAYSP